MRLPRGAPQTIREASVGERIARADVGNVRFERAWPNALVSGNPATFSLARGPLLFLLGRQDALDLEPRTPGEFQCSTEEEPSEWNRQGVAVPERRACKLPSCAVKFCARLRQAAAAPKKIVAPLDTASAIALRALVAPERVRLDAGAIACKFEEALKGARCLSALRAAATVCHRSRDELLSSLFEQLTYQPGVASVSFADERDMQGPPDTLRERTAAVIKIPMQAPQDLFPRTFTVHENAEATAGLRSVRSNVPMKQAAAALRGEGVVLREALVRGGVGHLDGVR